jgi:hypothetical protein
MPEHHEHDNEHSHHHEESKFHFPHHPMHQMSHMNDSHHKSNSHHMDHEDLLETLQKCEETCEHMTTMLKRKHDVNMRSRQLDFLRDCADICTLTSKYIARHSVFSKHIANLCAFVCEVCATECSRYPDKESQHCARVCLHCARKCKKFGVSRVY